MISASQSPLGTTPFVFVVADGAASSLGGAGWCYWREGVYYEGCFWAGRQATNIVELLAVYHALLHIPYGAEVLLWIDSRFAAEVLQGRRPIAQPDLKRLRGMILYHLEWLDARVEVELVKSAENELHSFVDRRARAQAQLAIFRHRRGEI